MEKVTEKTLLPISLVIAMLSAVGYIFNIDAKASSLEKRLTDLSARQSYIEDNVSSRLRDIDNRLSRMEGYLEKKK